MTGEGWFQERGGWLAGAQEKKYQVENEEEAGPFQSSPSKLCQVPSLPGTQAPASHLPQLRLLRGEEGAGGLRLALPPVALDAMGGDRAPHEVVQGALAAAEEGIPVVLLGDGEVLKAAGGGKLPLVAAPEKVGMGESALAGARKKGSPVRVGIEMLARGEASAFVSAGNTGAVVAASYLCLKRWVRRPALAAVLPFPRGGVILLDVGAGADARPEDLLGFARLGLAYAGVLGWEGARVGLLNIGRERGKGDALRKEAHSLLGTSGLPFVGNVEPDWLPERAAEVVVTDGFSGNLVLKTLEGAVSAFAPGRVESWEEVGGALLLGVGGVVVVAHGKSSARAVQRALRRAWEAAVASLPDGVARALDARA